MSEPDPSVSAGIIGRLEVLYPAVSRAAVLGRGAGASGSFPLAPRAAPFNQFDVPKVRLVLPCILIPPNVLPRGCLTWTSLDPLPRSSERPRFPPSVAPHGRHLHLSPQRRLPSGLPAAAVAALTTRALPLARPRGPFFVRKEAGFHGGRTSGGGGGRGQGKRK